ncbi:MAG: hypothetical protein ACTS73_07755 [Arsenophonus sp. NEOnobi-MAG3]
MSTKSCCNNILNILHSRSRHVAPSSVMVIICQNILYRQVLAILRVKCLRVPPEGIYQSATEYASTARCYHLN